MQINAQAKSEFDELKAEKQRRTEELRQAEAVNLPFVKTKECVRLWPQCRHLLNGFPRSLTDELKALEKEKKKIVEKIAKTSNDLSKKAAELGKIVRRGC